MKRVSFDSHQSPSFDDEARIRLKHQNLLQDYLDLQKEFVSKKKKLNTANKKRETLLAEVRFLRLRQAHLQKIRSLETEIDHNHQNFNIQPEIYPNEKIIYNAGEAVLKVKTRVSDMKRVSNRVEGKESIREAIRIHKKPKNCLINGKRVGKKKISLQDRVVLEA